MSIEAIIDRILEKEGGFVDHPADRGGPTKYGITEGVARTNGWTRAIRDLPEGVARAIYRERYWRQPGFDRVEPLSALIAEELADTGVNMGPPVAIKFLQRALNALNRGGTVYADIAVDGRVGEKTLAALGAFLRRRGPEGERVLLSALNCLQGERYIALAEAREANEAFVYGWLRTRVKP